LATTEGVRQVDQEAGVEIDGLAPLSATDILAKHLEFGLSPPRD
jgi:hypothetical protein